MKVELRKIDIGNNERSENISLVEECASLQVAEEQMPYIASNRDSLNEASANNNVAALSLYHKFGFQENGEMNDGEIVLNLNL